jgi:hypothetical protein
MAVGFVVNNTGDLLTEKRTGSRWTAVSAPGPGGQLLGVSCSKANSCEAVGQGSDGFAIAEVWDGTSWTQQTVPHPTGADESQLNEVSCTSPSTCEAVGEFLANSVDVPFAAEWDGSSWNVQTTPTPMGSASGQLNAVSCLSATECEAVGFATAGSTGVTLAEAWDGQNWTVQATPNTAGSPSSLAGVSCTSPTACMAVGTPSAERWNGRSWKLVTIAQPQGATSVELNRVSCTDRNHCMAVGAYSSDQIFQATVAEQWNGTTWQVQATPITTVNDFNFLLDVSCTRTSSCTAVGEAHDPVGQHDVALVEDWSLRWQPQAPATPAGSAASDLAKVSCASSSACVSVGTVELSGSTFEPLTEIWNGQAWTQQPTPNPAGSNLAAVSCTAANSCTAVGDFLSNGVVQTLAEHWDGSNWTVQQTPSPAGATRSFLLGVSCTSATACTAVGFSDNSAGNQVTLAERWDGSNWTVQQTPNPASSTTSQLNEVSCSAATACTAVGSATGQIWAEAWNGTSWTIQSTPIPGGGSDPSLSGVSCTEPNACTAVGSFFTGSRTVPLADRWDGTNWTTQSGAVARGSTASGFSSVSCPALKVCHAVGFNTSNGVTSAFAESWNGTRWSIPDFHGVPNQVSSHLSGISCSSVVACMGVGTFTDGSGQEDPLGEQYA